jgi:hypothetical protein
MPAPRESAPAPARAPGATNDQSAGLENDTCDADADDRTDRDDAPERAQAGRVGTAEGITTELAVRTPSELQGRVDGDELRGGGVVVPGA